MKYQVLLIESEEGIAANCPVLPGCWSQGKDREDALSNIREAIRLWLEVAEEDFRKAALEQHATTAEVIV